MSKLIEHRVDDQSDPQWWEVLYDRGLVIAKFVAITLAVYVLARLIAIPFGYEFFIDHLSSDFGLEDVYARPFAIALTALAVAVTPTLLLAALFGYRAKKVFVWILALSIIMAMATYLFTGDVYFDRVTGNAQKCYAKTLEGFKFSSTCDFDPKLGVRFQKINSDVMKEIVFWQKNGKLKDIPSIKDGQYFDSLTGESIVWYSVRPDGSTRLFSLPGFDPTTGEILAPITKEVIKKHHLAVAGHTTAVVVSYELRALLADIELALADGQGEYGSTESSRRALGNIWEWYFAQENIPKVKSSTVRLDSSYQTMIFWGEVRRVEGPTAKVEKVIKVNPYMLVVVSYSAGDQRVYTDNRVAVLDKDAHDVPFKSRPELPGLRDKPDDSHRNQPLERYVDLTLNPHETIRVMYFLKGTRLEQMNSGYVHIGGYAVEYSSVM